MDSLMKDLICVPHIGAELADDIDREIYNAKRHGEKFASLHEAYAVILEEVEEVWEITLQKKKDRDPAKLRKELIQVAAMAIKALHTIDDFVGGTV